MIGELQHAGRDPKRTTIRELAAFLTTLNERREKHAEQTDGAEPGGDLPPPPDGV